jgi:hypothetical protein
MKPNFLMSGPTALPAEDGGQMAAERAAHVTSFSPRKAGGAVRLSLEKPMVVAGR